MTAALARVAVPAPLRQLFDYRVPDGVDAPLGCRVRVPFGRTTKVGVVVAHVLSSDCPDERLKPVREVLDHEPLLAHDDIDFLCWVAAYYHHPVGEVVAAALPLRLRKAAPAEPSGERGWQLTASGIEQAAEPPSRAPRQAEVLRWLAARPQARASQVALRDALPDSRAALRALRDKGWLVDVELPALADTLRTDSSPLTLNDEQTAALGALRDGLGQYSAYLFDGVTGSGKTEVYLQLAAQVVAQQRSVLILVPEISLTPQLAARFRERLGDTVRVMHSGLSDGEREQTWHRVRLGLSRVLLGTRSAIFTPVDALGLVVVDEEHDGSYKQSEGFRYSARDLALVRASRAACPVVLGSATPSLESLRNVQLERYRHLLLSRRAGGARRPAVELIDVSAQPLRCGISAPLLDRVTAALESGEQVMLFLNRRGFAPVMGCFTCGWLSDCPRCDARQTLHRASRLLWCHHCGAQRHMPAVCPACGADDLHPIGQGTEQLEGYLAEQYAGIPLIRVDRDATARRGSLERQLERLHAAGAALLVGTQMLAKGHHFPRVTLVGVIDADGGLFSADYRATERLAQLLVQVAGRAGRGELPGRVLIQTRHPDHPLLQTLVRRGYAAFAEQALVEREAAAMPPFSHQALVRADATTMEPASAFLDAVVARLRARNIDGVELWGPVPAPMTRRAGRHRAHLLVQAARRGALHRMLDALVECVGELPETRRVRWSLDVDPLDLF